VTTPPSPPVTVTPLLAPAPLLDVVAPLELPVAPLLVPAEPLDEVAPLELLVAPLLVPSSPLLPRSPVEEPLPLQPNAVAPVSAQIPMTVAIFIDSSFRPQIGDRGGVEPGRTL
jgi:hypothetical protein